MQLLLQIQYTENSRFSRYSVLLFYFNRQVCTYCLEYYRRFAVKYTLKNAKRQTATQIKGEILGIFELHLPQTNHSEQGAVIFTFSEKMENSTAGRGL
jgi:hypothetical protein